MSVFKSIGGFFDSFQRPFIVWRKIVEGPVKRFCGIYLGGTSGNSDNLQRLCRVRIDAETDPLWFS